MKYFYCQSYQAFNYALYMNLTEKTIVITSVKNIVLACEYLKIEYIQHYPFNPLDIVLKRKKSLLEIVRLLNTIEEKEFHFSHTQFAVFCFLLVKKLIDKKNPVIFHDFEPVYKNIRKYKPKTINNFKVITTCILLRILYRLPLEIRESVKNSYIISLKQNYIHNSATQINNVKYIYFKETLQMFKSVDLNYPIINNLFIAQNIDPRFYKQDSVQKIIKIINNKNVTVKMHPKLGAVEGLNKCTILPEFLPVELFFNKVNTVVISIHSASLITASHFDNIKVISLIDIVSNKDPFIFKVKNELQKLSNNKIIFPKTICEFLKLIK